MTNHNSKRIVLQVLQREPDFSRLDDIPALRSLQGTQLLRWLDHSGLALTFLRRIESQDNQLDRLPHGWRDQLELRRKHNATRFQDMLREFQRINETCAANALDCVTMKGFSLVPDFCEDAFIRHQTDFDFLVAREDVERAAAVLRSCGYSTSKLSKTGESCFTTPQDRIPSPQDDIYEVQRHRQVDLHVSLTEESPWITMRVPDGCTNRAVDLNLYGVQFRALSTADRFLCQVLHAFRHCFRSWIRLSWLMEIGQFTDIHRENNSLWRNVLGLAGDDIITKRIFCFVLFLTNRLFKSAIPSRLLAWAEQSMTKSMRVWFDCFSENWALSDWPGNLSNLLLASDFIPDKKLRRDYFASRLLPKKAVEALGSLRGPASERPFLGNLQQWIYVAHRSRVHFRDLLVLPLDLWRWRSALRYSHGKAMCEFEPSQPTLL